MKELIEKYFQGETSLEEEATIKTYFNQPNIEEYLKQYAPLFQYFESESKLELEDSFEDRLFDKIDGEAKIVPIRSWSRRIMRIAAVAAIAFAAYLFIDRPNNPSPPVIDWTAYEINDEHMAYEETIKALKLLSSKLNKGKNKTAKEVAKTEAVTKYLN